MEKLYPFTAMRHTARGGNFQSDYQDIGHWWDEVTGDPGVAWSVLMDEETGAVVRTYRRSEHAEAARQRSDRARH